MKYSFIIGFIFSTFNLFSQDEFHLQYNEDSLVHYQGVIENNDLDKAALFNKGLNWFDNTDRKNTIDFKDQEVGKIVGQAEFTTIGKKSAYSKAYYYTFTCELILEFKDGKTRYTLTNFKKKSSPGEPGSTLEYFINNYKPAISSKKSRDREAKMLDQIEIDIQEQVYDLIDDLKATLGPEKVDGDW